MYCLDDLPDDPLTMPPPYWRHSSALFHLDHAVQDLRTSMAELVPLQAEIRAMTQDYFRRKRPEGAIPDDDFSDFDVDRRPLTDLEHKVKLLGELSCLMSAIGAEDDLNHFCAFNLQKDMAESIQRLALPEKLLVASAGLGQSGVRQSGVYDAARRLTKWRNAFAHGHCFDQPAKSLRRNHLIEPDELPWVPNSVDDARNMIDAYLKIHDYLRGISLNPDTAQTNGNVQRVRELLKSLSAYRFRGSNMSYRLSLDAPTLRTVTQVLAKLVETDRQQAAILVAQLAAVDTLQRDIVEIEFGLLDGDSRTLAQVADHFGVKVAFISERRALGLTYLAAKIGLLG